MPYESLRTTQTSALTPASAPRHGGGGGGSSRYTEVTTTEVYSDNEDDSVPLAERTVIDIDAVSGLGESAPTSLVRERKLNSDKSGKGKQKAKKEEKDSVSIKGKEKAQSRSQGGRDDNEMEVDQTPVHPDAYAVKAERISPVKPSAPLPDPNEGVPPPIGYRDHDVMMSDDEEQDRDASGRRVRMAVDELEEEDEEEVNEAQKLDLSESESEDEEDSMEGDFIAADGYVSARPIVMAT
jgi:DNA-directed RNA polymerase III subunit RPC4